MIVNVQNNPRGFKNIFIGFLLIALFQLNAHHCDYYGLDFVSQYNKTILAEQSFTFDLSITLSLDREDYAGRVVIKKVAYSGQPERILDTATIFITSQASVTLTGIEFPQEYISEGSPYLDSMKYAINLYFIDANECETEPLRPFPEFLIVKLNSTTSTLFENTKAELQISPNPFQDWVYFHSSVQTNWHVLVLDALGNSVYEGKIEDGKLSLECLNPGVYYFHLSDMKGYIRRTRVTKL